MNSSARCLLHARQVTVTALTVLAALAASADDWPQWRGPARDDTWNETGIRETFPPGGLKPRWRTPVGVGFSSPVVVKGRVYLMDARLELPRAEERIRCFDAATGRSRWCHIYEVNYPEWAFVPERGAGPCATPIVEAGKIYTLGANGRVHCLDTRRGTVNWTRDLGAEYTIAILSCRPSPLLVDDLLILFVGGRPDACVVALDKHTGKEVWRALNDGISNSSPILVQAGARRQLIVWTADSVTSLDPATGTTYWREPVLTNSNFSTATPVFEEGLLLVSGLMFRLDPDRPAASVLWPESRALSGRILSNTSTPLLHDGHIYAARSAGEFVCLDAQTGRQLWSTNTLTELKNGAGIQPYLNRDALLLFTDRGDLIRGRVTPQGYRESGRTPLVAPTMPFFERKMAWSPPSFSGGHVFVRNDEELICASLRSTH